MSIPEGLARVLVADDDNDHAREVAATLASVGFIVVGPASDGEQAIEVCRKAVPDLALLDIRMPKVNGLQAAEQLYHELGIPVVILSSHASDELVDTASQNGVFGYLVKPVSAEQLAATLKIAWGRFMQHIAQNEQIRDLRHRLEERRTIEQAKWSLVKARDMTEPEAMRALQRRARETRKTLEETARTVLDSSWMLD